MAHSVTMFPSELFVLNVNKTVWDCSDSSHKSIVKFRLKKNDLIFIVSIHKPKDCDYNACFVVYNQGLGWIDLTNSSDLTRL